MRDQLSAWALSDVGFIPFASGLRGAKDELTQSRISRMANLSNMAFGGASTAAVHETKVGHDLRQLRGRGYVMEVFGGPGNWAQKGIKGVAKVTEVTETGTRLGLWKLYYQRALKEGLTSWEAAIEAGYEASDYIDFGRAGKKMDQARRIVPFLNAQMQGLDKMFRTMGGDEAAQRLGIKKALYAYLQSTKSTQARTDLTRIEKRAIERGRKIWLKVGMLGSGVLHPDHDVQG